MKTVMQYENMSDRPVEPETQRDWQGNTGLYEAVNNQAESSVTVQEAEHTGQQENNKVNVKVTVIHDNQQHYENAAFDNQIKTVNVYEGLQTKTDDHTYTDLENN